MNYLGHAYLSFGNAEILTGNMAGDHIKGKLILERFPEGIRKGVMLHRKIDEYTDQHPATMRAKVWFRERYGLYSGAIIDTLYDHFLANDPKLFPSEGALKAFTEHTYLKLDTQAAHFPDTFAGYFPHMKEYNWLYNYRTLQGVQRSLKGLERRAQHMPPVEDGYHTFIGHYHLLNQCYYELIDDIISFVKIELSE